MPDSLVETFRLCQHSYNRLSVPPNLLYRLLKAFPERLVAGFGWELDLKEIQEYNAPGVLTGLRCHSGKRP